MSDNKLELTPEEVEEIKDDAVFKYKVISALKKLYNLPCETHQKDMKKLEIWLKGITTQVYFQWGVLAVILFTIIRK